MAARKGKPMLMAFQPPSRRITRSQAAANRALSEAAAPSEPLPNNNTGLKQTTRGQTKRGASSANAAISAPQPKRHMILKDVTNLCCHKTSKNSVVPTKSQLSHSHEIGRSLNKIEQCPKDPKPDSRNAEETQNTDLLARKDIPNILLRKIGHSLVSDGKGVSAGSDIVDIDKDNGSPQMCASYVAEIYTNLMASELIRRPTSNYMEVVQQDINKDMRGILIDWLIAVSDEFKLVADTLYLTVVLIDQFLSQKSIHRKKLQLLGVTTMFIASKYEEVCAPSVEAFCKITDNSYRKAEVLEMECQVLNVLGFHLSTPTPKQFLRRFLRVAQATSNVCKTTLVHLTNYLVEVTLIHYDFLKFLPSVVSASAVFLAIWTLNQFDRPWNSTLEHYTSYKSSDLRICVCALWELQHNISSCNLKATREKYMHPKYERVASLKSLELLESLFN